MTTAKIWNFSASPDGATLDISLFGEIGDGYLVDRVSSKEIAAQLSAHADAKKITVRINSIGGDMFGGVAIYNLLRAHGGEVTTIVDGLAASAASIVAMAGKRIEMGVGSMMMIHNPMTVTVGDANDHRQRAAVLDVSQDALASIYVERTRKTTDEIKALLDAETWMTAEEAVAAGFADEVTGEPLRVEAQGERVILNAVSFPRSTMPAQLLALALTPAAPPPPLSVPVPDHAPSLPPPPVPAATAERVAEVTAAAPSAFSLVDVQNAESRARSLAIAEDRARIRAILELDVSGNRELVRAAICDGSTPDQLLVNLYRADLEAKQAENKAMDQRIVARRRESELLATLRQSAPERTTEDLERQAAREIAENMNRRREKR